MRDFFALMDVGGQLSGKPKNKYGPDGVYVDDFCALLNDMAKHCKKCKLVIMNEHLNENQICPDCR